MRTGTAASSASVRCLRLEAVLPSMQGLKNTVRNALLCSLTHAVFEDIQ